MGIPQGFGKANTATGFFDQGIALERLVGHGALEK